MNDILYLVKNGTENEELRYSLRTIEKNFPYGRVWIYGGCPEYIKPDKHVYIYQDVIGATKWERTTAMLKLACENKDITDDFWLFNDDFFVTQPIPLEVMPNIYSGDLYKRIVEIEENNRRQIGAYSRRLRDTVQALTSAGYGVKNYATHTPMLINKAKALETIEKFSGLPMFRCLYGNMHNIGGKNRKTDVKISTIYEEYDGKSIYLSTTDESFRNGNAGNWIREHFTEPSRWER